MQNKPEIDAAPTADGLAMPSFPELEDILQDMRDLISNNRLAVLIGAGCSVKAGLPLMAKLTKEVVESEWDNQETKELLDEVHKLFSDKEASATIEDYMSEIVDFLSIVTRREQRGSNTLEVSIGTISRDVTQLQTALDEIKLKIANSIGRENMDLTAHRDFVRTIHGFLQSGKADRNVDYYVLNYDTLLEDALGLEKIQCFDGFTGPATGWWDSSTFSAKEKGARVYKIHGSVDWYLLENDFLPRRIRPGIKSGASNERVLIYPASTKYQEAQRDPFAQLMDHMRRNICPEENQQLVLLICGYSFGDSHVNLEIENALRQSDGRLTVVAFTSADKPEGQLEKWKEDECITDQVRVYANKGYFHGEKPIETEEEIPWWKFEALSGILEGER